MTRREWREGVWPAFVSSDLEDAREPTSQRGDEQRDPDGSVWIVTGYHNENGPYYSKPTRVRKGSLAASVIFGGRP
jgi:hypothetical protein